MAIGVPTGIKIFNWLGTMWGGKIRFGVPMMFCVAFLFQFLIAGLTGIMLSASPFDWQLSSSYFVVAHFHYVLIGGLVFTIFAALYYWFPKVTGRMFSDTLGKWHFWLFLIGFHLTFDFMHIPGVLGMPRRIYTYEPGRGWEIWNLIISIGVLFQILGVLIWVWNFIHSYFKGAPAGNDPWDAWTLEWSTTSPPPDYNFAQDSRGPQPPSAVGLETSGRSRLEIRIGEPMAASTITLSQADMPLSHEWRGRVGMWCLIAAESAIFSIFVVAYLYYAGKSLSGPTPRQVLEVPIFTSICLFSSSLTISLAVRVHRARRAARPSDCGGG